MKGNNYLYFCLVSKYMDLLRKIKILPKYAQVSNSYKVINVNVKCIFNVSTNICSNLFQIKT